MKITHNGVSFEAIGSCTLRPNVCSFVDIDGGYFNINTIALIEMYEMLESELKKNFNMTVEQVKEKYQD